MERSDRARARPTLFSVYSAFAKPSPLKRSKNEDCKLDMRNTAWPIRVLSLMMYSRPPDKFRKAWRQTLRDMSMPSNPQAILNSS